jgi:hypothetical protein
MSVTEQAAFFDGLFVKVQNLTVLNVREQTLTALLSKGLRALKKER